MRKSKVWWVQKVLFVLLAVIAYENSLGIGSSIGATESSLAAPEGLATIDSLLNNNHLPEALELAGSQWTVFQDDPRWNQQYGNRLAVALLRSQQYQEALPLLELLVANRPSGGLGHRNLGSCLVALGRKGRALSEYQVAIELEPTDFSLHLEYAQLLLGFRMNKDAGLVISRAVSLCGDCLEIQPIVAQYHLALGEAARAVGPLRRIWNESGKDSDRHSLLKALLDSGQDKEAEDLLESVLLGRLSREELQQLVALEGRLHQSSHSLAFANQLVSPVQRDDLPPNVIDDSVFWAMISLNLMNSGLNSEGLSAADRAVELEPDNVVFRNNRVALLQKMGKFDQADREWKIVLELDPTLGEDQPKP